MSCRIGNLALLCTAITATAAAQQPTSAELRDVAVELISSATLGAKAVEVVTYGTLGEPWPTRGGAYRVDLFEVPRHAPGEPLRRLAGTVSFTVGRNDLLWRLAAHVTDVQRRTDEFKRVFEANPAWTERDAIEQLRRSGARYLPPDAKEVRSRVSLLSLQRWLKVDSIEEPRFELMWQDKESNVQGPGRTLTSVDWKVLIRARLPNGELRSYGAVIEPFWGTITYLGTGDQ
jgi:hypothetical protein